MTKLFIMTLTFVIILSGSVFSEDLYLLEINDPISLQNVQNIVEHAHGQIDGKFLVYIDFRQEKELKKAGIAMELLEADCRLDDLYILVSDHKRMDLSAVSIPSIYSTKYRQLAHLDMSSLDVLAREGYMEFSLTRKNTPFFYNPPVYPVYGIDDYPLDTLAALMDIDSLYSYVTRMEDFYTRFTPTDSCIMSRNWIKNKFQSFGYDSVYYQYFLSTRSSFNVYDEPTWNVICVKEGTEKPDECIVIGGHYDTFAYGGASNPYVHSPGADDNASGVAVVLEMARTFKNHDFKRTVIFAAFGGEEEGLWGSEFLAEHLYDNNANVRFMANYDVISYEGDGIPDFAITTLRQKAYAQVFIDAAGRLNNLIPITYNHTMSSDGASFDDFGYQVVGCYEEEWHPDMHSAWDRSSTLDFTLMKKIGELGMVAVPIIDGSPDPVAPQIYDVGDGQSLRVSWDSCSVDYSYIIIYGTSGGYLNDTITVPSPECHYDITGLNEGTEYFAAILGQPADGLPPIGYIVNSETPFQLPRTPANFTAEPEPDVIALNWEPNNELDFNHYKLLRKIPGELWSVLADDYNDISYIDSDVLAGQRYYYTILAIDDDLNESDSAIMVNSYPATFDQGLLLVEETQAGGVNPTETEQTIYYNNILSSYGFTKSKIDSAGDKLTRSEAGQYNPIFWIDDDDYQHLVDGSTDTLLWYLGFDTDFLLAGWSSIYGVTGQTYFYPGDFYYDELGISYIAENPVSDFIGANGVNDWPDLELKPDAPNSGKMPNADIFTAAPEAEVIYTFNSYSSQPFYHGKPVGVVLDTYNGKRVVLGFPLYWLTEASAQALIARVMEYYAEESIQPFGDVNLDWSVNILDITYMINYLYKGGEAPLEANYGDPNGDCTINILDITYLISYLYKGGPEPVAGCVI